MSSQYPSCDTAHHNYLEVSKNGLPLKPMSKTTPSTNSITKANARVKPKPSTIENSLDIEANIDPNLEAPVEADDSNIIESNSDDSDTNEPTLHNNNDSIQTPTITLSDFSDIYDDGVPFEPLCRSIAISKERSWTFDFFEVQTLDGQLYTPKWTIKQRTNRRLYCKHCNWSILDSKRGGSTGSLIQHLLQHNITKNHQPKAVQSVHDMLLAFSKPPTPILVSL
jgi:hypothetical protein